MSDLSGFFQNTFGQESFDPNSVKAQADFEVLPAGKYPVLIEKAEVQPTKAGNGHFIYLEMLITDGQAKDRKLFDRINIDNPSEKCVEIGFRCLAALGQALGLQSITDSNQLVNQVVLAHVRVKGDQNEVRTYSAVGVQQLAGPPVAAKRAASSAAVAPVAAPVAQAHVAQAPAAKSPWAR